MAKVQYGVQADGTVSRCRAKPGNEGRYGCHHARHVMLDSKSAQTINEAVIAHEYVAKTLNKNTSTKSNAPLDKAYETLKTADAGSMFKAAQSIIAASKKRDPVDVSKIVPAYNEDSTEYDQLEFIMSDERVNLIGKPLHDSEREGLISTLNDYASAEADSSDASPVEPAEELAINTIMLDPNIDDKTINNLSSNDAIVHRHADTIIDYGDDKVSAANIDHMWETAPLRCLSAHRLPTGYLTETLDNDFSMIKNPDDKEEAVTRVFSHPNLDPRDAYSYLKKSKSEYDEGSSDDEGATFNNAALALSNNPDPKILSSVVNMDSDGVLS